MEGQCVINVKILLEDQPVLATSMLPADQMLETIKKTKTKTTYVGLNQQWVCLSQHSCC